jgi:hypothetical protein
MFTLGFARSTVCRARWQLCGPDIVKLPHVVSILESKLTQAVVLAKYQYDTANGVSYLYIQYSGYL